MLLSSFGLEANKRIYWSAPYITVMSPPWRCPLLRRSLPMNTLFTCITTVNIWQSPEAIQYYTQTSLQLDRQLKVHSVQIWVMWKRWKSVHSAKVFPAKKSQRQSIQKNLPSCTRLLNIFLWCSHSQWLALCYRHPAAGIRASHPALAPAATQRRELACTTISLAQRQRAKLAWCRGCCSVALWGCVQLTSRAISPSWKMSGFWSPKALCVPTDVNTGKTHKHRKEEQLQSLQTDYVQPDLPIKVVSDGNMESLLT